MANLFNQIGLFGASAASQLPQPIQPAKLGLLDRLGQRLVPSDSQWQPSADERKAMVKRGLLEAGLTMLATPTGAGNSPVMGIARGLLAGQQGIRADAEDMRSKALGLDQMRYGNAAPAKVREIESVASMLGLVKGTPEFKKYVETQVGLSAKATNMSEWKTSVTQSGEIIRTNEAGGAQILDRNTRQWQDLAGSGEQPTDAGGGNKQFIVGFAKDFQDAMGRPPTEQEVAEFTNAVMNGGDYSFTTKPPAQVVPPTTPLAGRSPPPLPSLVNPKEPKAETWDNPVVETRNGKPVRVQYGSLGGEKVLGPAEAPPPVKTATQIEAETRKADGAREMSRVLKTMLDEYKSLDEARGITNTNRGVLDNVQAYARASDTGQVIGRMAGSKDQSARDTINAMKPQVLSAVIAASGMSAKQLDSNAEMKLWLSATSDPQTSYQTVLKVTDNLLKKFTGKGIEQFSEKKSAGSQAPSDSGAVWVRDASGKLVRKK